jgi:hypothetical protein
VRAGDSIQSRRRLLVAVVLGGVAAISVGLTGPVPAQGTTGGGAGPAGAERAVPRAGGGTVVPTGVRAPRPGDEATPVTAVGRAVPALPADPARQRADMQAAARAAAGVRGKPGAPPRAPAAPVTLSQTIAGINQAAAGGARPPDTSVTVGPTHILEAVNSAIRVFRKSDGVVLSTRSLGNVFGNTTDFLFDPRVFYDPTWNKYVLVATRRSLSDTDPNVYMHVGVAANPAGAWTTFRVTFSGGPFQPGNWLDFPMLGMDQDAVIISTNVFDRTPANGDNFVASSVFSIAKARLYNGFGFNFSAFGVAFSTQPPIVAGRPTQQDPNTYLAAFTNVGTGSVILYRMTNTARPAATSVVQQATIAIGGGVPARDCNQPGTSAQLDCSDPRISQHVYQNGTSLWGVHNAAVGAGFPVVRYFELNTATNGLKQAGNVFFNGTSDDANGAIAINSNNEAFITWTAVDAPNGGTATMRVARKAPPDPLNGTVLGGTQVGAASTASYTDFRLGDYSQVAIDWSSYVGCPAGARAYAANELFTAATAWTTRIARFGGC